MRRVDVLVVGDANPDLVLRGDVRPRWGQAEQLLSAADLVLGGSGAITACGCARLGLRTAMVAAVGADQFGGYVRDRLAERGVGLDHVRTLDGLPTGLSVILSGADDRAILTLPGTIPAVAPGWLGDDVLAGTRHLHVAALFLQPDLIAALPEVLRRARALGVSVSVDTNWDPAGRWDSALEVVRAADVLLPNAAELAAITGEADPDAAAARLVGAGVTVVLKDGARGARAWWPGGSATAPALAVDVVDTTGAGDSFNAGFLAAHLRGRPVAQAAAWAAAAGSLSTRTAGGTGAQPTLAELTAALSPSVR
jgi:sugar/nucleoside kinase (ribokinase family)